MELTYNCLIQHRLLLVIKAMTSQLISLLNSNLICWKSTLVCTLFTTCLECLFVISGSRDCSFFWMIALAVTSGMEIILSLVVKQYATYISCFIPIFLKIRGTSWPLAAHRYYISKVNPFLCNIWQNSVVSVHILLMSNLIDPDCTRFSLVILVVSKDWA